MSFKDAHAEVTEVLKKHGIQTYALVLRDPDSNDLLKTFDGMESDVEFGCRCICEMILQREVDSWKNQL